MKAEKDLLSAWVVVWSCVPSLVLKWAHSLCACTRLSLRHCNLCCQLNIDRPIWFSCVCPHSCNEDDCRTIHQFALASLFFVLTNLESTLHHWPSLEGNEAKHFIRKVCLVHRLSNNHSAQTKRYRCRCTCCCASMLWQRARSQTPELLLQWVLLQRSTRMIIWTRLQGSWEEWGRSFVWRFDLVTTVSSLSGEWSTCGGWIMSLEIIMPFNPSITIPSKPSKKRGGNNWEPDCLFEYQTLGCKFHACSFKAEGKVDCGRLIIILVGRYHGTSDIKEGKEADQSLSLLHQGHGSGKTKEVIGWLCPEASYFKMVEGEVQSYSSEVVILLLHHEALNILQPPVLLFFSQEHPVVQLQRRTKYNCCGRRKANQERMTLLELTKDFELDRCIRSQTGSRKSRKRVADYLVIFWICHGQIKKQWVFQKHPGWVMWKTEQVDETSSDGCISLWSCCCALIGMKC